MAVNEKILDKVRKILAKTENNPSAEEAQTAMLIAQRIMVQHGITMENVDMAGTEPINKEVVDISITDKKRVSWWEIWFAKIIAENFRCKPFIRKNRIGDKRICLIGLKQDAELAREVIGYAIKIALYYSKEYLKQNNNYRNSNTAIKNSWLQGFGNGLEAKFKEQVENNGWGLILVKDQTVLDAIEKLNIKKGKKITITTGYTNSYRDGYKQGHSFESRAGVIPGR